MAGNSRGFIEGVIGGIRVGGDMSKNAVTYYPAHSKNGVNISARCTVRGCINVPARKKGMPEKTIWLTFTFWGKVADVAARSMSPGKEFDVLEYDLNQYEGQVYYRDPSTGKNIAVTMQTPQGPVPLKDTKIGIGVRRFRFGAEAAKFIAADDRRKPGWDQEGTPANAAWKKALADQNAMQYVPGQPTFGYARVIVPTGAGIGAYDYTKDARPAPAPMVQAGSTMVAAINAATAAGAVVPPAEAPAQGVVVTGLSM